MKFTNSADIDQVIYRIEQGIEEHSKWIKLWNSKAICQLPFPEGYLEDKSYEKCEFAKWFYSCKNEQWLHEMDYDSITSVHRMMHEEAKTLAEKIQDDGKIDEETYYRFVNYDWGFTHQLYKLKDKISRLQISFDPLTKIFNRQAMMPILLQEKAYIERDGKQCCLAMADLDYFKKVNDTHGHANGDQVLRKVAGFFRSNLRPYDALFRYGGEEFLFCLPNADIEAGRRLLDRLRVELEKLPIKISTNDIINITVSIGVTRMVFNRSVEETIEMADHALYEAKNAGRNCVIVEKGLNN